MTDLLDKVVLVTGAAGGFGREMIGQFAEAGSRLLLTDLALPALEEAVAAWPGAAGAVLGCVAADLSGAEGCERVYRWSVEQGVDVDVLVNNAGLAHYGAFHQYPAEKWEEVLRVNLVAPMRLTHHFLPGMIERRQGHIVNISSAAGWLGSPGLAPYSATKFGLRGFGEAVAREAKRYNVLVTTVYPFFSRTPIIEVERFGTLPRAALPERMLSDPADVVRQIVHGIRDNRHHVFPDKTARRIYLVQRYAPWLLPYLLR
jgi:short-subunit dehydrogenase